jgi:hypothetical protein
MSYQFLANSKQNIAYGQSNDVHDVEVWVWWYEPAQQYVITVRKPDGTIAKNWLGRWVFDQVASASVTEPHDDGPVSFYDDAKGILEDEGMDRQWFWPHPPLKDGGFWINKYSSSNVDVFYRQGPLTVSATLLTLATTGDHKDKRFLIHWSRIDRSSPDPTKWRQAYGWSDPMDLTTPPGA